MIRIERIELLARIGVPDDERAQRQRLTINIALWPGKSGAGLNDDIALAVDYAEVCAEVRGFVDRRNDKLIETLADKLAFHLLEIFGIRRITIELRKYVLPDVEFVSVTVTRERAEE